MSIYVTVNHQGGCVGRVSGHAWLEHGRSRVRARRAARLPSQLSLLGKRLIPHSASVHSAVNEYLAG